MPGSARDRACATAAWLVGCAPCMPSLLSGGAPVITDTFMRHRLKCVRDHGTGFWVGGGAAASAVAGAVVAAAGAAGAAGGGGGAGVGGGAHQREPCGGGVQHAGRGAARPGVAGAADPAP